jgi:hypothetical protein
MSEWPRLSSLGARWVPTFNSSGFQARSQAA